MKKAMTTLLACAAIGAGGGPFATSALAVEYAYIAGLVYNGAFIWVDFIDITSPP